MKVFRIILIILHHVSLTFAVVFLIYAILDWYNPLMGFLSSDASIAMLLVFCADVIVLSVYHIFRGLGGFYDS